MASHRFQRSMVVAGAVMLMLGVVPQVAGASGGGGCGAPVTDAAGTSVEIDQFCFSPTILRAEPGAVVTFTNGDPVSHDVLGAHGAWGSWDALKRGREISFRFVAPGVFPYVCAYHPGMVGVVVVGDGIGGAIGTTTKAGPVTRVSAKAATRLLAAPAAVTETPAPVDRRLPVLALVGIVLVAGVALGARRRSRRRSLA